MNKQDILTSLAENNPDSYIWNVKELGHIDQWTKRDLSNLGYNTIICNPRNGCDHDFPSVRETCSCNERLISYKLSK